MRRNVTLAAWVGLAITALSFGLRYAPPVHPIGLLIAGVFPFLVIGVVVACFVGVVTSQKWLAAASAITMAIATLTIWPFDAISDCRPFGEPSPDSLIVYQANVLKEQDGGVPARYRSDILLADPDILLLQEVTPEFAASLDDGSLEHLSFRSSANQTMVWSRFPIEQLPTPTHSGVVPVRIDDGFGPIQITSVHTAAPASRKTLSWWREQFDGLAVFAADSDQPRIMGGDFNATDAHQPFRRLVDQGLTDVHDVAGCGMDATWPVRQIGPVSPPPFLRLDHVLFSEHFDVMGMRVGPAIDEPLGSDHHPVVVEFRRR